MRKIVLILAFFGLLILIAVGFFSQKDYEPTTLMKLKEKYSQKVNSSVDHSKFTSLQQNFSSPQQVTATCINCHNKRHVEVMQSNHWNWEREEYVEGREIVYLGKKNAINNGKKVISEITVSANGEVTAKGKVIAVQMPESFNK